MFSWDLLGRRARNWLSGEAGRARWWGLAAMVLVFAVHSPSLGHDYCAVDDTYFVLENPVVQGGLTWAGIKAAWTTVHASYWAPLLWLSFMVDQEISGGAPWSFHLTNVLLFAASSGLLYALVRRWTGRSGIAFATTLLWALHPARVESVAWISERKDVLSGLFFLLGLWFYTVGREQPPRSASVATGKPQVRGVRPTACRLPPAAFIFFAWLCMLLGGMAKQIVIVMPVALILLDIWPLGRTDWNRVWRDGWRLVAEKWAFWLLAIAFAALPIWTHLAEQAFLDVPFHHRLAMIPIHYLFYLEKIFWPTALAPLQDDLPWAGWKMGAGLGVLIGLTALTWRFRARAPWALWGWLWFAGLLFPLSGVMWAGSERIAVRFLYVPQIGLTLALAVTVGRWGAHSQAVSTWKHAALALILLLMGGATLRTLSNWRDPNSFGLWILDCHPQQGGACAMGGDSYLALGQWTLATDAYDRGVSLGSRSCLSRWGMIQIQLGHPERAAEAWDQFEKTWSRSLLSFSAWERAEERELAWRVRGQILLDRKDYSGAIAALGEATQWEKDDAAFGLAEHLRACLEAGRPEAGTGSAERLAKAAGIRVREWRDLFPFYAQAWKNGARGLAYGYFAEYAERFPDDAVNLNYMARLLATALPDGLGHARQSEWSAAALRWVERAMQADPKPPLGVWETLAAARAANGDSAGAVQAAEMARDLARETGEEALVAEIEKRIAAYRMGLAWQE